MFLQILLLSLIFFDLIILYFIFSLQKRQNKNEATISELTEERQILQELRTAMEEDAHRCITQIEKKYDQLTGLAAEIHIDTKNYSKNVEAEITSLVDSSLARVTEPLKEFEKRIFTFEEISKKIENEKKLLQKLNQNCQIYMKFFDGKINYQSLEQELQEKKINDVRSMLVKGYATSRISKELGIAEMEVKAVSQL